MDLTGIHHLTAVSADIRANKRFYTEVLGMRLVKRSVNQDDVGAYHLFYADAVGSPGTDITFFDWRLPRERRGTHAIVRTHLRVTGVESLDWWAARLKAEGVAVGPAAERDGRATLDFEDPEGQRLALVDDGGHGGASQTWSRSPVPAKHQIRGLGPIVLSVPRIDATDRILTGVMNMRRARDYSAGDARHTVVVYEMGGGGPHAELHVAIEPDLPVARLGAGGVHHVAFRTPTFEEYDAWTERLSGLGVPNSGPIDRYYFRSLYFREPNGILFEIATDGPGFAVDENPDTLGEDVALPPFLEPHRSEILANLAPID
jgi:glyoxalase family protein